jgi:ribosomal protein L33
MTFAKSASTAESVNGGTNNSREKKNKMQANKFCK